jgi:dimethylhistidine N-methyltransferase
MSTGTRSLAAAGITNRDVEEIHYYLSQSPKQLPSHLLYDSLGSSLFEAICLLPWYQVTRAELRLLVEHGSEIGRRTSATELVELGCGNGRKLQELMRAMAPTWPTVHLVDVSEEALNQTTQMLHSMGVTRVAAVRATYEDGLMQLPAPPRHGRRLLLFLGSNIGNFDPPGASAFVQLARRALRPQDWLLLGVDLVKPEGELKLAYDDPLGVTAAFNRNLLLRLNKEAGANFDLDGFRHAVVWNRHASRIEMHLVSLRHCDVQLPGPGGPLEIALESGESIWTESSYKYEPDSIRGLVETGGFAMRTQWIDTEGRFLLGLFEAVT